MKNRTQNRGTASPNPHPLANTRTKCTPPLGLFRDAKRCERLLPKATASGAATQHKAGREGGNEEETTVTRKTRHNRENGAVEKEGAGGRKRERGGEGKRVRH